MGGKLGIGRVVRMTSSVPCSGLRCCPRRIGCSSYCPILEEEEVIATTTTTKRTRIGTFARKAGHFLWNFVRMCLPGCLGAGFLSVAFFGAAALVGHPDVISQAPVFSTLVLTINFTLPMLAWMSFRHRERRPTLEMAGASMALGIILVALGLLGIIPMSDIFEWEASLCCPAMLVPMLFRRNLYTGSAGHHAHST